MGIDFWIKNFGPILAIPWCIKEKHLNFPTHSPPGCQRSLSIPITIFHSMPKKKKVRDRRAEHLHRSYVWRESIYDHVLMMQGGRCAICGTDDPAHWTGKWMIDHDHETGHPRGLLCFKCNSGIGQFQDNTEYLANAINYLNYFRNVGTAG